MQLMEVEVRVSTDAVSASTRDNKPDERGWNCNETEFSD